MRFHGVRARLAKALLAVQDRTHGGDLPPLTHSVLADMLGVRRGAVTLAAADLQRDGFLRYQRGKISILDRRRLEAEACSCYRARHQDYRRALSL
jgi:CRP-like cAMP-binding protein